MIHRESIPIEDYTNEFEISYLAEFAKSFREHVIKKGVRSCFFLEMPLYLPGETKTVSTYFQRKGNGSYECHSGDTVTFYPWNDDPVCLKDIILKDFHIIREWDDEIGEVYFYGLHIQAKIFCQIDMDFSFKEIPSETYRISDYGVFDHTSSALELAKTYDIEDLGDQFSITLPNLDTKYTIRKFLDFVQFACAILK